MGVLEKFPVGGVAGGKPVSFKTTEKDRNDFRRLIKVSGRLASRNAILAEHFGKLVNDLRVEAGENPS